MRAPRDDDKSGKPPTKAGTRGAESRRDAGRCNLHLFEQMRERPADGEIFLATLDLDGSLAAEVARHRVDRGGVDHGGAMDLPEFLGIEAVDQLLDRRL